MNRKRSTKFTLIELLIVVSIISILASLLLPALARARNTSLRLVCSNKQKQITLAVSAYVCDFNDYFPIANLATRWHVHLLDNKYLPDKAVFYCPKDTRTTDDWAIDQRYISYGYNAHGLGVNNGANAINEINSPTRWSAKITKIKSSSNTLLVMDAWLTDMDYKGYYFCLPEGFNRPSVVSTRHLHNQVVSTFVDSHIDTVGKSSIEYYDPGSYNVGINNYPMWSPLR